MEEEEGVCRGRKGARELLLKLLLLRVRRLKSSPSLVITICSSLRLLLFWRDMFGGEEHEGEKGKQKGNEGGSEGER